MYLFSLFFYYSVYSIRRKTKYREDEKRTDREVKKRIKYILWYKLIIYVDSNICMNGKDKLYTFTHIQRKEDKRKG